MPNENIDYPVNDQELVKEYKTHKGLYRSIILAFRPTHLLRDERALNPRDQAP